MGTWVQICYPSRTQSRVKTSFLGGKNIKVVNPIQRPSTWSLIVDIILRVSLEDNGVDLSDTLPQLLNFSATCLYHKSFEIIIIVLFLNTPPEICKWPLKIDRVMKTIKSTVSGGFRKQVLVQTFTKYVATDPNGPNCGEAGKQAGTKFKFFVFNMHTVAKNMCHNIE